MIIALAHQKGGVGKSTMAWNLAIAFQKKYNVVVLDLDMQQTMLNLNKVRKNQEDGKPLDVQLCSTREELINYMENESGNEDRITIVDVGGFDSDLSRIVIAGANLVVTPVSDKAVELMGIQSFERILGEISDVTGETCSVRVLLNQIDPRKSDLEGLREYIDASPHFDLFKSTIRSRADYNKAIMEGKNVIEYDKKGKASKELKALITETEDILGLNQNKKG